MIGYFMIVLFAVRQKFAFTRPCDCHRAKRSKATSSVLGLWTHRWHEPVWSIEHVREHEGHLGKGGSKLSLGVQR